MKEIRKSVKSHHKLFLFSKLYSTNDMYNARMYTIQRKICYKHEEERGKQRPLIWTSMHTIR